MFDGTLVVVLTFLLFAAIFIPVRAMSIRRNNRWQNWNSAHGGPTTISLVYGFVHVGTDKSQAEANFIKCFDWRMRHIIPDQYSDSLFRRSY